MAEATPSLPRYPSVVIGSLIRSAAREAVKHNIRAQGLRVTAFLPREISVMAEAFIGNNRDKLLAGALRAIERGPELQRMLEKEQRVWAKAPRKGWSHSGSICGQSRATRGDFSMTAHQRVNGKSFVMRPVRRANVEYRVREHLTETEVGKLLAALKANRHGHRDWLIGLMIYRHGLRVSEACDLRWDDIDLAARTINIRRGTARTTLNGMRYGDFADCRATVRMCS
jgi:integrase